MRIQGNYINDETNIEQLYVVIRTNTYGEVRPDIIWAGSYHELIEILRARRDYNAIGFIRASELIKTMQTKTIEDRSKE